MECKVVAVAQIKGGTGKSTLATNLSGYLSQDLRVALVDADQPQGTSSAWAYLRKQANKSAPTVSEPQTHRELCANIEQLKKDHDILILDTPARNVEFAKVAMGLSDLTLIVAGMSAPELWATQSDLPPVIDAVRQIRPDLDARILWNRVRKNTKLTREVEAAAPEMEFPTLKSQLGFRAAYMNAIGEGLTVAETGDKAAKMELINLVGEIRSILWGKK